MVPVLSLNRWVTSPSSSLMSLVCATAGWSLAPDMWAMFDNVRCKRVQCLALQSEHRPTSLTCLPGAVIELEVPLELLAGEELLEL